MAAFWAHLIPGGRLEYLAAAAEHPERALIQRALKMSGGTVEDAAKALGLSRKGLYLKRLRFGIE